MSTPTWQRLRDKMDDVKVDLPEGTVGPFVNSDFGDVAIATIAITGEGFSYREMKDVAEEFPQKAVPASQELPKSIFLAPRTNVFGWKSIPGSLLRLAFSSMP